MPTSKEADSTPSTTKDKTAALDQLRLPPLKVWDLNDKAMLKPISPLTTSEKREQRIQLYTNVLALTQVPQLFDSKPNPYAIRERIVARFGLIAETGPLTRIGSFDRKDPVFIEQMRQLRKDLKFLKSACENSAKETSDPNQKRLYETLHEPLESLMRRYQAPNQTRDFRYRINKPLPEVINEEKLKEYVRHLRMVGTDKADGWYVDREGNRIKLFSYTRFQSAPKDLLVGMRSSGKAITGIVTVRFLEEYATSKGTTLKKTLDTPVIELCEKLRSAVERKHSANPKALKAWGKITFRNLITHASGFRSDIDETPETTFTRAIARRPDPEKVGTTYKYINAAFEVVNLALQELIEKEPGRFLGARTLADFIGTVMKVNNRSLDIPNPSIPRTATTSFPTPHGRGLASSTTEEWSMLPEVLKQQSPEALRELLDPCGNLPMSKEEKERRKPELSASGFYLRPSGLHTQGHRGNDSEIILQTKKPEGMSHGEWVNDHLKDGYIVIVKQADAPNIPCIADEKTWPLEKQLLNELFI